MAHQTFPRAARARRSVSVVIPCYRYGHYLPGAVAAALDQRSVDVRVIIVDDCSPDDSLAVARDLARRDDRVRVIAHETNQGHIQTYNDGLAVVDTDFFALVSADDLVAPRALDRAAALMDRFPRVGMVFGEVVQFEDEPPRDAVRKGLSAWRVWGGHEWAERISAHGHNPIISPEVVVRTAVLRQIGGYNPALPHSGDLEYWLKVATAWDVGQVRGRVQAFYRVHGANMHLTQFASNVVNIRQKMGAFAFLAGPDAAQHWPQAREVHARASGTLVAEALAYARQARDGGDPALEREFLDVAHEIAVTHD
jgi:glycosyltransferase involved in cell wall biosynthesis